LKKGFIAIFSLGLLMMGMQVRAQAAPEAPDLLVKRISDEVFSRVKADRHIQNGDGKRIRALVETVIMPHVDFDRTTALTVGRHWRAATPEQKKQITHEYSELLMHTYAGAIAQIKDQRIQYRPFRADPEATDVVVYSQVLQTGGVEPIQLNYRLKKEPNGWKIYDINVLGAWLIQTYKNTFSTEVSKGGLDGLIAALKEKNRDLARRKTKK
jgi:phospholipid transport system substrate-binding protein